MYQAVNYEWIVAVLNGYDIASDVRGCCGFQPGNGSENKVFQDVFQLVVHSLFLHAKHQSPYNHLSSTLCTIDDPRCVWWESYYCRVIVRGAETCAMGSKCVFFYFATSEITTENKYLVQVKCLHNMMKV